jgi:zinc/manganese transport system substrate-binding protein
MTVRHRPGGEPQLVGVAQHPPSGRTGYRGSVASDEPFEISGRLSIPLDGDHRGHQVVEHRADTGQLKITEHRSPAGHQHVSGMQIAMHDAHGSGNRWPEAGESFCPRCQHLKVSRRCGPRGGRGGDLLGHHKKRVEAGKFLQHLTGLRLNGCPMQPGGQTPDGGRLDPTAGEFLELPQRDVNRAIVVHHNGHGLVATGGQTDGGHSHAFERPGHRHLSGCPARRDPVIHPEQDTVSRRGEQHRRSYTRHTKIVDCHGTTRGGAGISRSRPSRQDAVGGTGRSGFVWGHPATLGPSIGPRAPRQTVHGPPGLRRPWLARTIPFMRMIPIMARVAAPLLAIALLAGCGSGEGGERQAAEGPVVVATTSILGDITANVVGDLARVEVLMPRGTDPHDFEASARQVETLRSADLVVANGLELEEGLEAVLASAADAGVIVLEVAPLLDPQPYAGDHGAEDETEKENETDHHGDGLDPHVWMDVTRVRTMAGLIAEAFTEVEGIDAAALAANLAVYDAELAALDAEITDILSVVPDERRLLVTNHDAFGYLASSQGFEIVGTVLPSGSPLAEPSPADLVALADQIRELGVPAIFTENTTSTDLARTLAAEAGGVAVIGLYSDSLGPPDSDGDTYIALMRANASRIAGALG